MKKKILMVVTSHAQKGDTGESTGYHLAEVSNVWKVLKENNYEMDFVSPKGGKAPVDAFDLDDEINNMFWESADQKKVESTKSPDEINSRDYSAIYFAGGHGCMWDLPDNQQLQQIAKQVYQNGGVIATVCHGSAVLVNLKMDDGKYLVEGKAVNSFTDAEEKAVGLDSVIPFLLESKLRERGAEFEYSDKWQAHVVVHDRLVSGQNPASATPLGYALVKLLGDK